MEINKKNALEEVTKFLKSMKCVFTYDDCVFEIIVGSESCFIQVEIYDSMEDDDLVTMQFYDNADDALFEICEEVETTEAIEEYANQIISFTKEKVKNISKIYKHIKAIEDICENNFDPSIEIDRFIEINYDFEDYNN